MARIITSGFEHGSISAERQGPTSSAQPSVLLGTPTLQTTIKRSGQYAYRFQGGDGSVNQSLRFPGAGGTTGDRLFTRAYIYVVSYPAAGVGAQILTKPGQYAARISSTGQIGLWTATGGVQIGSWSAAGAVALNTWQRVELMQLVTTTAGADDSAELRLDGTTVASETNVNRFTAVSGNNDFGMTGSTFTGGEWYFDDLAINDATGADQNSWPGEGSIATLWPTADSAVGTNWMAPQTTGADQTNIFDAINDTPPVGVAHSDVDANNLKYIFNAASDATGNYDATLETYAAKGIGASDTITFVQPVARVGSTATAATAGAFDLLSNPDGGAETSFAEYDAGNVIAATEPTGWKTIGGGIVSAPSVTVGTAPVLRIGKRTATTRVAMVSQLGLVVEYVPVTTTPVDGAALALDWDTRAAANGIVEDLKWDVRAEVNGIVEDLKWDVRNPVSGASQELIWDTRVAVNGIVEDLKWDTRAAVNGIVEDLKWDLRSAVDGGVHDLKWDLRSLVNGIVEDLRWDVRAAVNGSILDAIWDTRAAANGIVEDLKWDLRAAVNSAVTELIWDLTTGGQVNGVPLDLTWDTRAAVNSIVEDLRWDLRSLVNGIVEDLRWDLRTPVNGGVHELIWDTRAAVNGGVHDLRWDLRSLVNGGVRSLKWDTRSLVNGLVRSLIWDTRVGVASGVVDFRWNLTAAVNGIVEDLRWDLRAAANGAVLDLIWDLAEGVILYVDYDGPLMLLIDPVPDRGLSVSAQTRALVLAVRPRALAVAASEKALIVPDHERSLAADGVTRGLAADDPARLLLGVDA